MFFWVFFAFAAAISEVIYTGWQWRISLSLSKKQQIKYKIQLTLLILNLDRHISDVFFQFCSLSLDFTPTFTMRSLIGVNPLLLGTWRLELACVHTHAYTLGDTVTDKLDDHLNFFWPSCRLKELHHISAWEDHDRLLCCHSLIRVTVYEAN